MRSERYRARHVRDGEQTRPVRGDHRLGRGRTLLFAWPIGANETLLYSVTNTTQDLNVWRAYINGISDPHTVAFGPAAQIEEGAEWRGNCNDSFSAAAATFGSTHVWQRWKSSSWVEVQSSYWTGNVCGFSFAGGPTGQWTLSH
jgi:hypothetical protein